MRNSLLIHRIARPLVTGAVVLLWSFAAYGEPISIDGPVPLTKGLADNGASFRDAGVEIRVQSSRGATAAITAVGEQTVDIAVLSRGITALEKAKYPTRRFFDYVVAAQAFVPAVARNVWDSGVKSITKEQMQKIYEGKVTQWSELGGDAGEIKFFKPAPETPAADLLTTWLYDDPRKAPESPGELLEGGGKLARNSVEFTRGAIAMMPPALADGKEVFQLGLADSTGRVVQALEENLIDRSYPLGRPVFFIYGNRPTGKPRELLDFLRTPEGKAVLISADLTPVTPKVSQ